MAWVNYDWNPQTRRWEVRNQNRTAGGNVSAEARRRSATLSGGRFPIFDRRSAMSAIALRGHTRNRQERSSVLSRAARYAPEAARAARQRDRDSGLL